jgi:glycosyltransferase involved in cell wall biosynthesis
MSSKPKIAYILTPITFGGSDKVNLTYLRNADRSRFDINPILLIRPWEAETIFAQELKKFNYSFYTIPVAKRPSIEGRDYFRVLRCFKMIYSILKKASFDLVHTHGYFADIIGMPISKILHIPHISTCHGFISNDRKLKIYNSLDKLSLRFCERIIAVSEEIKNGLLKKGINESKIVVIQNAVQNSYGRKEFADHRTEKRRFLSIEQDEFVIGYVGRLSEEKGVHYLIEAGSVLKESFEPFKIIIIGDGPRRKELKDLTKLKGLEREIIFTGFQSDVENWLPALDVFVLPSLTEGTPMALLEAMSVGIPIIATSVGGVPKIVENEISGFLIEPADFRALAEKIIILKENPVLRNKMAMEGLEIIKKRFDVHEWCRKIEREYDFTLCN